MRHGVSGYSITLTVEVKPEKQRNLMAFLMHHCCQDLHQIAGLLNKEDAVIEAVWHGTACLDKRAVDTLLNLVCLCLCT